MEANLKRISEQQQVQVLDDEGRTIGVISGPVEAEILGPGREKVYLSRRPSGERSSHAA